MSLMIVLSFCDQYISKDMFSNQVPSTFFAHSSHNSTASNGKPAIALCILSRANIPSQQRPITHEVRLGSQIFWPNSFSLSILNICWQHCNERTLNDGHHVVTPAVVPIQRTSSQLWSCFHCSVLFSLQAILLVAKKQRGSFAHSYF